MSLRSSSQEFQGQKVNFFFFFFIKFISYFYSRLFFNFVFLSTRPAESFFGLAERINFRDLNAFEVKIDNERSRFA